MEAAATLKSGRIKLIKGCLLVDECPEQLGNKAVCRNVSAFSTGERADAFSEFINSFLMLDVIVFIMHKDLNTVLSCLVFLEDNSILLLAVNPITLLGQGGAFCANIFGRSEKIILCG